ncbi:MAG: hypothetical protein GMKNLPBB_02156 [Myxococcota bacterium]|nr:hypothetical protein [Myxococcota bacterium]
MIMLKRFTFALIALALLTPSAILAQDEGSSDAAPAAKPGRKADLPGQDKDWIPPPEQEDYTKDDYTREAAIEEVTRKRPVFGGLFEVNVYTREKARVIPILERALDEARRIDGLMSESNPESDVSRINANAGGKMIDVQKETIDILEKAVELSKLTNGAFDVTYNALTPLWKFDELVQTSIPKPAEIKKLLPLIDYKKIRIQKNQVVLLGKGMSIGLGGLAKGYAVDRVAAIFREAGIQDFRIKAGHSVYASGKALGKKPWEIAIPDPREAKKPPLPKAPLNGAALFTSWDNEKYFVYNGRRYHNILDPATGMPADKARSVSVIAPSALDADALAVAIFILGPEKGFPLLKKKPGSAAVLITPSDEIFFSDNFDQVIAANKEGGTKKEEPAKGTSAGEKGGKKKGK